MDQQTLLVEQQQQQQQPLQNLPETIGHSAWDFVAVEKLQMDLADPVDSIAVDLCLVGGIVAGVVIVGHLGFLE